MRTLVVSDLHLGSRLGHDVLRGTEPRERLLDALDGVDRLVLLGDVVELMEGRPRQALAIAEPILRELGARLGPDRRVMLVPGNHDAPLVRAWVRAQGRALGPSSPVPADASPTLAQLVGWLEPARVQIRYPGAWLSERVWATHGHYLDRHLLPESAYGILSRRPSERARPIDYELARRPSMSRVVGRLPRPLAALLDDVAELARAATMPRLIRRHLLRVRFAPLTAALLGVQVRRASIPALLRVVERLGIDAEWVIFGHVHRLGPLEEDAPETWRGTTGRPRVANTGSWVHEPLLIHRAKASRPYWPGGAVLLEDGGEPRAISLLGEPFG
ncbi:MAG TPA: metallophosphoesterase [Solirubrobacteraceae bacterium]|nr:metallophosphoesterase [Solirubrobacteraceae bacterium]